MAIQLTNSFQKVAEVSYQVTSNTTGYSRLYLKYDDRDINELTDKVYYEIRQYSYNPYGNYLGWGNTSSVPWHIKSTSGTVYASGTYTQPNIYSNSGEVVRASGSFIVEHNDDGTWEDTINFSAYVYTYQLNKNADISLPNIDRLATITSYPESLTDEDTTITFSYNNPANFKIKVYAMVTQESSNGFAYDEYLTGSPFTWEWLSTDEDKEKLYSIVRSSPNATFSLRLQTYNNNDEFLGITAVSIPLTIVNAEPFVEVESEEQNEKVKNIVNGERIAVNYVSQLKATATFTGSKGATLKKISINNTVGNTSPFETVINVIDEYASSIFGVIATVEDSRGLTDGGENIYQLVDYRPITINSYKFKRENPTSDVVYLTAQITYWDVTVNDVENVPILSYSTDGTSYTTIPTDAYTVDATNKLISINNYKVPTTLDYKSQGTYYLKVEDNFTDDVENDIVTKGIPIFEKGEHDVQVNGNLFIADEDRQNRKSILDFVHPIGSYYETSVEEFNPNIYWGGTWELEEDGTALVSKSATEGSKFNADIGTIVGSETHTLTVDELAEHNHALGIGSSTLVNGGTWYGVYTATEGPLISQKTGGNQAHNNVQPSKIVNRWHRIA